MESVIERKAAGSFIEALKTFIINYFGVCGLQGYPLCEVEPLRL